MWLYVLLGTIVLINLAVLCHAVLTQDKEIFILRNEVVNLRSEIQAARRYCDTRHPAFSQGDIQWDLAKAEEQFHTHRQNEDRLLELDEWKTGTKEPEGYNPSRQVEDLMFDVISDLYYRKFWQALANKKIAANLKVLSGAASIEHVQKKVEKWIIKNSDTLGGVTIPGLKAWKERLAAPPARRPLGGEWPRFEEPSDDG